MSDAESFLERWARRKRDAANSAISPDATSAPDGPQRAAHLTEGARHQTTTPNPPPTGNHESPPAFDLAKLPSLESITAETDIRAFLLPGVPAELSRAALRRAWSADPAIREFVGLADYDWDFNTEGAITGFGPLEMTDELRRQVTKMVGRSLSPDESEPPGAPDAGDQTTPSACENLGNLNRSAAPTPVAGPLDVEVHQDRAGDGDRTSRNCEEFDSSNSQYTALQHQSESGTQSVAEVPPRRHGKALPK